MQGQRTSIRHRCTALDVTHGLTQGDCLGCHIHLVEVTILPSYSALTHLKPNDHKTAEGEENKLPNTPERVKSGCTNRASGSHFGTSSKWSRWDIFHISTRMTKKGGYRPSRVLQHLRPYEPQRHGSTSSWADQTGYTARTRQEPKQEKSNEHPKHLVSSSVS